MTTRLILAAALAANLTGAALGADEHAGAANSNPMTFEPAAFIAALVAFGIAAFILHKFVWPKILKGLQDRENKMRAEIEAAEQARRQAAEALKQYEKSLAEARAEAQAMLEKTKGEQQKLAAELKAKADVELAALRERATRDIEAAKREAINEIYGQATAIASELAAKILQREIRPDDHRRLIEQSLGQLETVKG
ncbi:MAG: F0F1 ATP synthase subunit B [Phycisphaerales bacterium]|nr:F0F1 ATP synthase subunit B [Phycisphaerales bacterium]